MAVRETLIDFATWLSGFEELDVATPDEAVDLYLADRTHERNEHGCH